MFMNRMIMMAAFVAAMMTGGATMARGSSNGMVAEMNVNGGKKASRQMNVAYFSKIDIKGGANVVFRQTNGGKPKVTVAGYKADVDMVSVKSDGRTLTITQADNRSGWHVFGSGKEVTVYVSAPDLTAVNIFGSGDFRADGKVDTDNLLVVVKGSGDVDMRNVICDNADIQISGSGDVEIKNLVAQRHAGIKVYGSGDVEIKFTRSGYVTCGVYGSGDVELKGYVKGLKKNVKGSGEIETDGLKRW